VCRREGQISSWNGSMSVSCDGPHSMAPHRPRPLAISPDRYRPARMDRGGCPSRTRCRLVGFSSAPRVAAASPCDGFSARDRKPLRCTRRALTRDRLYGRQTVSTGAVRHFCALARQTQGFLPAVAQSFASLHHWTGSLRGLAARHCALAADFVPSDFRVAPPLPPSPYSPPRHALRMRPATHRSSWLNDKTYADRCHPRGRNPRGGAGR